MIQLQAADATVTIAPEQGARAVSWLVGERELLGGIGSGTRHHGLYPMAPWAGRIRDNSVPVDGGSVRMPATLDGWAMHGLVLDRGWDVLERTDQHARLQCRLGAPWPWAGSVTAGYHLSAGQLAITLTVATEADKFPATVGWHPWFRRTVAGGAPVRVDLPGAGLLPRGEDHLPSSDALVPPGPGPFDDCFHVPSGVATLTWAGALSLTCTSTATWFVLFDEPTEAVCLEPQTHPPDALRTADLVSPDLPLTLRTVWSWTNDETHPEEQP